jgi:transcriptional regulator with XRE-family HTH domain
MDINYDIMVSKKIKILRKEKKLSQEQLAAKLQVNGCDLTRSALAKIEAGQRHIYLDELKTIAYVLKVPYNKLLV